MSATLALHDLFNTDDEALASKLFIAYKKMGESRVDSIIKQVKEMVKSDKKTFTPEEKEKLFHKLAGAWANDDSLIDDIRPYRNFKEKDISFDK